MMYSRNSSHHPSKIRSLPTDLSDRSPPPKRRCACRTKRGWTVIVHDRILARRKLDRQMGSNTTPKDTYHVPVPDDCANVSLEPTPMTLKIPVQTNLKTQEDVSVPRVTIRCDQNRDSILPPDNDTIKTPTEGVRREGLERNNSSCSNYAIIDPNGEYVFEEITQHLEVRFVKLLQCDNFSDSSTTDDLRFVRSKTNYSPSNMFRLRIADKMDELGIIKLFMRIWQCIHNDDYIRKDASTSLNNLVQVVSAIWNLSDISRSLCEKISRSGILQQIMKDLEDDLFCINNLTDDTRMHYIKGLFAILHNICRHYRDSREILRNLGAVETLQKFLNTEAHSGIIQFRVLLILCYLINETESNVIHANDSHINYIVTILKSAVESQRHFSREFGFSASEILCGLNHLAANDCNKQKIVNSGALPLYVTLLQPDCNTEEQKIASRGLWTLAFDDTCKCQISDEESAVSSLEWLVANSTDERTRNSSRGALWEVNARWRVSSISREHGKLVNKPNHIMISYQWDSKSTMLRVKDTLQANNHNVWMDVMDMSGSTLEAMALAVERATVVIVCLSQKYKDSPNCRTEAEYTYRLRKRIIPLVLEPTYSPDGWLGIMIGTRLYFDFSQDNLFEQSIGGLLKELGKITESLDLSRRASDLLLPGVKSHTDSTNTEHSDFKQYCSQMSTVSSVSTLSSVPPSSLIQFPFRDLNSWLTDNGLRHLQELNAFSGDLLREMQEVQRECPEFLYSCLQREYNLPLVDVLKLSRALRRTTF